MPTGAQKVLDRRSLEKGNEHIIPFLRPGINVLDIGCGSGAITSGIAENVDEGRVVGIDVSEQLVSQGREKYKHLKNLSLDERDIFEYEPNERFDLITSARTLQWLGSPESALQKMKRLLKPGGIISILDYNHEKIEWTPTPPVSMLNFYNSFLTWRRDAGMNNRIADDLHALFLSLDLTNISVVDASEFSSVEQVDFKESISIWTKVAETRGHQLVHDGYLTETERLQAIEDYNNWITTSAKSMKLYLLNVSARLN